ncbi:hypothetical protein HAX54_006944 [Datura stramonium]|uniref:Uncharacterized protein n=1 Tax=Datura stramonium TaxID=4076 RepID=A0ABS8TAY5_DATST|nr:hypothetical protein [Datura stramonium]
MKALNRLACPEAWWRSLHIQYSVPSVCQVAANETIPVSMEASELDIPGLYLIHDFISANEEGRSGSHLQEKHIGISYTELLAAVDTMHWKELAKRRVQHYGYEFQYSTRNVNTNQYLGELPSFLSQCPKMSLFQKLGYSEALLLDQLTVNEYPPGVGPDTLSDEEAQNSDKSSKFLRKAIYLPPRSMLLLSGKHVMHGTITFHTIRVLLLLLSFLASATIMEDSVRKGPCECEFPEYCDSQKQNSVAHILFYFLEQR